MMSKELEYTRKPDGGLAEHIEVLEAFADGDADNTICECFSLNCVRCVSNLQS
ncbi:hypothetical protein AAH819_004675 [Yersinia enterocolitica]